VFGSAINIPGTSYINYLIPAIIIQTVLFGAMNTGIGLAEDFKKGLIGRFRSLPMSRSAVFMGRTAADSIRNVFTVSVMIAVGYAIGFRIETNFGSALLAILLAVLLGYSLMWGMALIAMMAKESETVQMAGMVFIFPLTFASSAFVPTETMPAGLKWFAEHSPVTESINTLRGLFLTGEYTDSLWKMLVWIAVILIVFFPLAVRQYKKVA